MSVHGSSSRRVSRSVLLTAVFLGVVSAANAQDIKVLHYGGYDNERSLRLTVTPSTCIFDGYILIDRIIGRWGEQKGAKKQDMDKLEERMRTAKNTLSGRLVFYTFVLGGVEGSGGCFDWGKTGDGGNTHVFLGDFSRRAAAAGLTGICLDMEAYVNYYWSSGETGVSAENARVWGRKFGDQIWGGFPACELLIMHGGPYDVVTNFKTQGYADRFKTEPYHPKYDLYPCFLVGLLESLAAKRGQGQLHLLLESSYDATVDGKIYDEIVKEVYRDVGYRADQMKAPTALTQWQGSHCTIALGAWPLGSWKATEQTKYCVGANCTFYTPDSVGSQLNNFRSQQSLPSKKQGGPGAPKYVWMYGQNGAWLETRWDVVSPYVQKIVERWPLMRNRRIK